MTSVGATFDDLRRLVRAEVRATVVTWVGPASDPAASDAPSPLGRRLIVTSAGERLGSLGSTEIDRRAIAASAEATESGIVTLATGEGEIELFVELLQPPPKLIVVGAVHVAVHLVHFAKRLGFRCLVLDARAVFATAERFPHADELIVAWPSKTLEQLPIHDESYCVFLTHDPKLDDPAIAVALRREARYVGALGSKRTHAKRIESLRELGVADDLIQRIHAPIGLDLGGRKPEEIALAIAAELVAVRYGRAE